MKETNDLSTKCNLWTQLNFRILTQSKKESRKSKFILDIIINFSWWHNSITVVIEKVFRLMMYTMKYFPWRREWLQTPLFLSAEFHGERSYSGIYRGIYRGVYGIAKSQTWLKTEVKEYVGFSSKESC